MIHVSDLGETAGLIVLSIDGMKKKTFEIVESSDGEGFLFRTRHGLILIEPLRPDFIKISIK